jgi:Tfp pilus assembly protein FimT
VIELLVVIGLALIITAIALPSLSKTQASYRVSGDARNIAQTLTLAKMKAGANFTQERLTVNVANNTYQMERYSATPMPNWTIDGGVQSLDTGVTFGFGSIGTAPPNSQGSIAETTPVVFDSRGIAIDGSSQPTGADAIYLSNSAGYYAITVGLSGRVQVWKYANGAWVGQQ